MIALKVIWYVIVALSYCFRVIHKRVTLIIAFSPVNQVLSAEHKACQCHWINVQTISLGLTISRFHFWKKLPLIIRSDPKQQEKLLDCVASQVAGLSAS